MTNISVSNRSELLSALSSARGGETITLADGHYGGLQISRDYASMVTIQSETPLGAEISGLRVMGASNLRFDGLHVNSNTNGNIGGRIVEIAGESRNIELVNSEVHGRVDGTYVGSNGIQLGASTGVVLKNNYVHDVHHGIAAFHARDFKIIGNEIDYVAEDLLKFSNVRNAVIEENVGGANIFRQNGAAHPDYIQFESSSSNIEIRNNVFLAESASSTQGIFLWDGTYTGVVIEGNILSTGHVRGISIEKGTGNLIQDNTLLNVPGEFHPGTLILVPSGNAVKNNIQTDRTGWSDGTNLTLQNVDPNKPFYVEDYIENGAMGRGLTLDDLRIVPGSLAETMGAAKQLKSLKAGESSVHVEPVPVTAVAAATASKDGGDKDDGDGAFVFTQSEDMNFRGMLRDIQKFEHSEAMEIAEGSIGFSFSANGLARTMGLISKDAADHDGGGNHFTAYVEDERLRARFEDGSDSTEISTRISARREYDVLATFDEDQVRLYLDGELVGQRDFSMDWRDNPQYLQIGGTGWSSASGSSAAANSLNGTMRDVAIHNRALTPDEFDQLL
jgi:parallel beta-helix repeat protein